MGVGHPPLRRADRAGGGAHDRPPPRPTRHGQERQRDVPHLFALQRPFRAATHPRRHPRVPDAADPARQGRHRGPAGEVQGTHSAVSAYNYSRTSPAT